MATQTTAFPRTVLAKCLGIAIRGTERSVGAMRAAYRRLTGQEAPVVRRVRAVGADQIPAVPIEMSVAPGYIVCLEDGMRFKMLKGHLRAAYHMTPEEYRAKWGLPADYPMVAPDYREKRVRMARDMGLGHMRKAKLRKKPAKTEPADVNRGDSKRAA